MAYTRGSNFRFTLSCKLSLLLFVLLRCAYLEDCFQKWVTNWLAGWQDNDTTIYLVDGECDEDQFTTSQQQQPVLVHSAIIPLATIQLTTTTRSVGHPVRETKSFLRSAHNEEMVTSAIPDVDRTTEKSELTDEYTQSIPWYLYLSAWAWAAPDLMSSGRLKINR